MADAMEILKRRMATGAQQPVRMGTPVGHPAPAAVPTPVRAAAPPQTPSLVVPEGFILVRQAEIDGLNQAVSQAVAACGEVKADLDRLRPEWEADKAELAQLRAELAHLRVQGCAPVDAASDAAAVDGSGDGELWSEAAAEIERLTLQIAELVGAGPDTTEAVAALEAQVAAGAARIAELEAHVAALPAPVAGSNNEDLLGEATAEIERLTRQVAELEAQVAVGASEADLLGEAAAELGRLTEELADRDAQVLYLKAEVERMSGGSEPSDGPQFERWTGPGDILDLKVADVPAWGGRTKNCLRNAKIDNIRDLLQWKRGGKGGNWWTTKSLMGIKNFGEKCITEVEGWLAAQGLALAGAPEPVDDDDFLPEAEPLADDEVDPTELIVVDDLAELPPEPGEPVVPAAPPVHDVSTNGVDTAESAFAAQLAQLFG